MKLTVQQIREKYPNPVASGSSGSLEKDECYCVGGAFVNLYRRANNPFPTIAVLASCLESYNPRLIRLSTERELPCTEGRLFAEDITRHNDLGEFEMAWFTLEQALNY